MPVHRRSGPLTGERHWGSFTVRLRQSAALTAAAATAVLALPAVATAEPADTIYVDNTSTACADNGSGTAAQPFCSITAAANAVLPGQTVRVAPGTSYRETVTITRSGTPDKPITFLGLPLGNGNVVRPVGTAKSAFVLANVHDVVLTGFRVSTSSSFSGAPAVTVTDSSRVTLDRLTYTSSGPAAVRIAGAGDHVTVSRSTFSFTGGVSIGAGVHDSLITTNDFNRTTTAAITATDAPGLAVTYNTVVLPCAEGVKVDGASPGALVENNVISAEHRGDSSTSCVNSPGRPVPMISLSAASTTGSKADYNIAHPIPQGPTYAWADAVYPTADAFTRATGQAAHDVDLDLALGNGVSTPDRLPSTTAANPVVDSADPSAPGVGTDLLGVKPADDPTAPNTAPGGGVRDRGAYERLSQSAVTLAATGTQVPSPQGPVPFTVQVTAKAENNWGLAQTDYTFDFGDGTDPVHSATPTATHVYTKAGIYWPTVITTDAQGGTAYGTAAQRVEVRDPADLTADLSVQDQGRLTALVTPAATSPYAVTKYDIDFGDGTRVSSPAGKGASHQYSAPGTYTVTVTATDEGGRTAVAKKAVELTDTAYVASLQPGQRVQLLARSGSNQLLNTGANYTNKVWAPFLPVPQGGVSFAPKDVSAMATATTADQYLRAFVLVGGKIYSADRHLGPASGGVAQGQWLPWKEVAGTGTLAGITQISAASIGNSTHLVAVAGGRVYEASSDRATGVWSAWGDVTGVTGIPVGVTSVAAGTTGNSLHIAILGSDGHLRVADGDYNRGRWSYGDVTAAYGLPAGMTQVAAASTPGSRFHVVVLGINGHVYETTGDYAAGYWTGWGDISDAIGSGAFQQVAAASTGNTIRIFGRASSGAVLTASGDYTAGQWSATSTVTDAAAAGATDRIDSIAAAGL
ncbi:PKD domain-containing protein [Kitasatospora cinereorecta]|uniref:PKD domain-containing protein n=1 Tax=Kitasatospora cinereorecta TaxID=285560 RepID=UPI0031F83951